MAARPDPPRRGTGGRPTTTTRGEPPAGDASVRVPPDATPSETRRTESTGPMSTAPSEEDIRMRAYLRYVERGGGYGLEFDDWVEAERELKRQK